MVAGTGLAPYMSPLRHACVSSMGSGVWRKEIDRLNSLQHPKAVGSHQYYLVVLSPLLLYTILESG